MAPTITWLLFAVAAQLVPASASGWPGPVCRQQPYSCMQPFYGYPAAESYCSSAWPVKPITHTVTITPTRTKVVRKTSVLTTTTTTTTETTTAGSATLSSGPTITNTATLRRRDNPAKASQWHDCSSRLYHAGGDHFSAACSCIQRPSTTTVTKTAPARISTVFSTIDTTSISTSTTVTSFCTPGISAISYGFSSATGCGSSVTKTSFFVSESVATATSYPDCYNACNKEFECCAFNFDAASENCELLSPIDLFGTECPTSFDDYTFTPDPDYDYYLILNPTSSSS